MLIQISFSELIDVLHHNATVPGSKMTNDYPYLLNKHFPSRSGDSTPDTVEADEDAWLSSTQGGDRELWDEVKGLRPGALVFNLDEPGELDRNSRKTHKGSVR